MIFDDWSSSTQYKKIPTKNRFKNTLSDKTMIDLATDIENAVARLVLEGARDIKIEWINIADQTSNPLNDSGFFMATGTRPTPFK